MSSKKKSSNKDGSVELHIDGHLVSLSFAEEPDMTIAQRVRSCLLDSYIRQNVSERKAS